jgi:hypothetical protein
LFFVGKFILFKAITQLSFNPITSIRLSGSFFGFLAKQIILASGPNLEKTFFGFLKKLLGLK